MQNGEPMDNIAVIILNYNTWIDTLKEVEMVHDRLQVSYHDIIVIDNHSENESYERLLTASEGTFCFIQAKENRGYAWGNNIGLRYAYQKNYQYAWILNNDILWEDESILKKLLLPFQNDTLVAVVSPDIYAPDGHMFNRDAVRPSFYDLTFGMLRYRRKGRMLTDRGGYGYVYRPQGCCMMVDLKALHDVDYMDENTFLYSEEFILAERLLKRGYKCACCTSARIVHNHSITVKSAFHKRRIREIQEESYSYYLNKYREFSRIQKMLCRLFYRLKLHFLK